jgi:hypothetical protein
LPSHNNILSVEINGRLKQLKVASADIEDNLRSGSYSWVVIDEACYCSEEAWNIIAPTLRGNGVDFNYQVLFISSPAGKNWLYTNFIETKKESIEFIQAPSIENFFQVSEEKLALWKETMSSRMYAQEIEANILDSNLQSIFYAYTKDIVQPCQIIQGNMKFTIALDQNVSPGAGVVIQVAGKEFQVLDEIYIDDGANYSSYVTEIIKKVPHKATLDICGDASGNARNVASIDTFYQKLIAMLKDKGFTVYNRTNKSNPKVFESREEVNRLIERKLLRVDPKCKHLIKDFEQASWKEKSVFETDKARWDPHTAEALVYGIWAHTKLVAQPGINF